MSAAVDPARTATVFASAGTGKTWQLVTRLLRLLLADAPPGSILAVTFTRKAAGEMQERLLQRLADWAICDTAKLRGLLEECGAIPDAATMEQARGLYETVLNSPQPVRTTTFHSFCHDLLARFPLEAGVPPGFELIEDIWEQKQTAWDQLMKLGARHPDSPVTAALSDLFDAAGGGHNTRIALNAFLNQRSDWWAYTETAGSPLDFALDRLNALFELDENSSRQEIIADFFCDHTLRDLQRYASLLAIPKANRTNMANATAIADILSQGNFDEAALQGIHALLVTQKGTPRKLTLAKTLISAMSEQDYHDLLQLHEVLPARVLSTLDTLNRLTSRNTNRAWLIAGSAYLDLFQEIKAQRRQLDFSDLEWKTYQLLNTSGAADAVQYKLDQQIDHLLIDEFQDTNPTQWRLVYPLLAEFAAAEQEKPRTVFLVGDTKQSIYSFRRANPALQGTAATWLQQHLGSKQITLNTSWRSAPAIMDAVNAIFRSEPFDGKLDSFDDHSTHQQALWGRIEILPPIEPAEEAASDDPLLFRNPLQQPLTTPPGPPELEAGQIAARIVELVDSGWQIGAGEEARPIHYGDIMILLRQRTHAAKIEQALRAAGIPFRGAARGSLLDRLEVLDIRRLLELLATPQDNLALAHVLRSPLFTVGNDDLITLTRAEGSDWYTRLLALENCSEALSRAAKLLTRWRQAATLLPLHDLLDRIYFEGNVIERYRQATSDWQQAQVVANLQRLLELALEIDSGRYPSLARFTARLNEMASADESAPSEPTPDFSSPVVEIMTIHGAKGLEAPVVFFANLSARGMDDKGWSAIVEWPADSPRPRHFLLQPTKANMDSISNKIIQQGQDRRETEAANLLYVALTRARQMLVLTASAATSRSAPLFSHLRAALGPLGTVAEDDGRWIYQTGTIPQDMEIPPATPAPSPATVPKALSRPIRILPATIEINPSRLRPNDSEFAPVPGDADGALRGTAIHRMLELLTGAAPWNDKALCYRIAAELNLAASDERLPLWLAEAKSTIEHFPALFAGDYLEARNEAPVIYRQNGQPVYGIIDRLLIFPHEIQIIDYKTHRIDRQAQALQLKEHYQQQMAFYRQGIEQLYPDRQIHCRLLFTAAPILLEI
jgi:ATP-dependent helicase/nuclease subunit A